MSEFSETKPKMTMAGYSIIQFLGQHRETDSVRNELLALGVAKGTVSKITTVLDGLRQHVIELKDVRSLNQSYELVKLNRTPISELIEKRDRLNELISGRAGGQL